MDVNMNSYKLKIKGNSQARHIPNIMFLISHIQKATLNRPKGKYKKKNYLPALNHQIQPTEKILPIHFFHT